MKIAFFDTHRYDREAFIAANNKFDHSITFFEARLTLATANLASGFECICAFVNDKLDRPVLRLLAQNGTRLVALRSAGFNHVDLAAAREYACAVARVPEYSPHAVAEHALALILALNRKTHRAYNRVRDGNFSLEGLVGFDLHGKTVGVIGTGKIGAVFANVMLGLGCRVLACDTKPDAALVARGVEYTSLEMLLSNSAIVSLHVPLNDRTRHLVNSETLALTRPGVMLINTGRGALIETAALIDSLKAGHIGSAGLNVYEEEEGIFFSDHSGEILQDDQLVRLMTFPNVLITSHQAFLTQEALANIAEITLQSVADFAAGRPLQHEIRGSAG